MISRTGSNLRGLQLLLGRELCEQGSSLLPIGRDGDPARRAMRRIRGQGITMNMLKDQQNDPLTSTCIFVSWLGPCLTRNPLWQNTTNGGSRPNSLLTSILTILLNSPALAYARSALSGSCCSMAMAYDSKRLPGVLVDPRRGEARSSSPICRKTQAGS